nr:hypothetical protein [Tanacetum cinerariifolium]
MPTTTTFVVGSELNNTGLTRPITMAPAVAPRMPMYPGFGYKQQLVSGMRPEGGQWKRLVVGGEGWREIVGKSGDVKTVGDKLKLKLKAAKDQATKKTVDPKPNPKIHLNQNQKKPNHVDRGVFTMIPMESYISEPGSNLDVGIRETCFMGEAHESRGDLTEDAIENLKRSDGFRSEDVIDIKRNDYHI